MTTPTPGSLPDLGVIRGLLRAVNERAASAGVFGAITLDESIPRLTCAAANSAEPAEYRLDVQQGRLWVSLVTANRWLSESIETDLLHTGDKLDELIEEELDELGFDIKAARVTFEHFRSDDKLFTFRSPIPAEADAATKWLLAYEACFRRLGDMDSAGEEE